MSDTTDNSFFEDTLSRVLSSGEKYVNYWMQSEFIGTPSGGQAGQPVNVAHATPDYDGPMKGEIIAGIPNNYLVFGAVGIAAILVLTR